MARRKTTADVIADSAKSAAKSKGPTCPKCGQHEGWNGPRYQHGKRVTVKRVANPMQFKSEILDTVESLDYTCNACGYVRHEACNDQR